MGLTAATRLRELGLTVTIYSDRKPLETTSSKAGGQWAVSVVEYQGKEQELTDIIKIAYTTFKAVSVRALVSLNGRTTRHRHHTISTS